MAIFTLDELYELIAGDSGIAESEEKLNRSHFKGMIAYSDQGLSKDSIGRCLGKSIFNGELNDKFNAIMALMTYGSSFDEIMDWYDIEKCISLSAMTYFNQSNAYSLGFASIEFCDLIHKRAFVKKESLPIDFSATKVKIESGEFTIKEIIDYSITDAGSDDSVAINYLKLAKSGIKYNLNGIERIFLRKLVYYPESKIVPVEPPKQPISEKYNGTETPLDTGDGIKKSIDTDKYLAALKGNPNFQLYPRKYYSGSDAQIFFNDQPVAEIIAISYGLQETHVPIYGYASYTFDAIAKGQRLVSGTIRINFTEEWYLKSIMTKLSQSKINSANPSSPYTSDNGKPLTNDELFQVINRQDSSEIKQIAEKYEDYIWGKDSSYIMDRYQNTYFADKDSELNNKGFDIIIPWGNELYQIAGITPDLAELPGTVTVLNGVRLTGVSKVVEPTGNAVYEEYSFIARDLNNTIISESAKKEKVTKDYQDRLDQEKKQRLNDLRSLINDIIWLKGQWESANDAKLSASETAELLYPELLKLDKTIYDKLRSLNYNDAIKWYTVWLYKNNLPPRDYIAKKSSADWNTIRKLANDILYCKGEYERFSAQNIETANKYAEEAKGYYTDLLKLSPEVYEAMSSKNYKDATEYYDSWLKQYNLPERNYTI